MAAGDVFQVEGCPSVHYVDTGMYGTSEYGCVYLLDGERPALVETGIGTNHERILSLLDEVGVAREDLAAMALTHVHLDHAGGAGFLAEACPNATVYVHEIGAPHLADPTKLVEGTRRAVGDMWEFYVSPEPVPEDRIEALTDGDTVDLGDRTLTARHVPGHAPHQVVFHDDRDDAVYTGDAAGIWVPSMDLVYPTSPPPNFDLDQCLDDVETIRGLDPERLHFTHFGPGPADVDGILDEYRDALSEWVESVRAARADLGDDAAVQARFADATEMAPVWGERKAREEAALNARGAAHYIDHG